MSVSIGVEPEGSAAGTRRVLASFTVALACLALSGPASPTPFDIRVGTIAIAVVLGLTTSRSRSCRSQYRSLVGAGVLVAWLLISSAWSSGTLLQVIAQMTFIAVIALLVWAMIERRIDLRASISLLGVAAIGVSIALWIAAPERALVGGRLVGFMSSATGFADLVVLVTPAIVASRRRAWVMWPVAGVLVWASGTRGAALALLVGLISSVFGRAKFGGRVLLVAGLGATLYFTLPSILAEATVAGAGSSTLLRGNNSRAAVWSRAWESAQNHVVFGAGLGSPTSETGSSILAVLIEFGVVGMLLVGIVVFTAFRRRESLADWRFTTVLAGSVLALFEGWLVSAGTVFSAIYWLCVVSLIAGAPRPLQREMFAPAK